MSVFKKLVGFLFEEEEEIEEEGALEEVSFREVKQSSVSYPEQELPAIKRTPVKEQVHVESVARTSTPTPAYEQQPLVQEEKKFTTIELSREEEKKPVSTRRSTERTTTQRAKPQRNEPAKSEFEFTPVISPIFGADEKEVKHAKQANVSVPPVRATIPASPKKNPLGTILSPIYGATELEEFEMEAKERLEERDAQLYEASINEPQPSTPYVFDDEMEEDEEVVRVPLEDLLSGEDHAEQSDDLLQFSLFGDDEVVSTEKSEDTYTIKE